MRRQEYWELINNDLGGDGDLFVMADETSKNELTVQRRFYQMCLCGGIAIHWQRPFARTDISQRKLCQAHLIHLSSLSLSQMMW